VSHSWVLHSLHSNSGLHAEREVSRAIVLFKDTYLIQPKSSSYSRTGAAEK
jgi:hypothetical protein